MCVSFLVFFFKQKTAYESRISDWSSDVCSPICQRHLEPLADDAARRPEKEVLRRLHGDRAAAAGALAGGVGLGRRLQRTPVEAAVLAEEIVLGGDHGLA